MKSNFQKPNGENPPLAIDGEVSDGTAVGGGDNPAERAADTDRGKFVDQRIRGVVSMDLAMSPLEVCCVCFVPIHSGHQLDIPAGVTQKEGHRIFHPLSFCGAYLNFSREKDSAIPFSCRL